MKKQTIKFKRSKNSIKNFTFLNAILITIILITSCSKDNYYNTNVVNNGIEEIPISELQNDEVFKAIFSKKFNNKSFDSYLSSKNAITHKEKDEFYFPEKNAVIMKSDSLISYTMLIKRNDKKVNYFENLVIQINSKNQYSVNIVKYYPKKFQEQKEHNSFSLESDKELVMISKDNKQTNKSNLINNQTCITITYSLCNHSYIHIAGPNCGSIFKTVSETVCFDTPSSGDSSNNGSNDNGSGTWGWNYSDSITFPGSGGSYEDGDGGFTINTTPIDPRLDMGIDGSVTYTESYHAFFSQIFYNNLTDLKPWADENPNLYNLILSNVINNNWSVQSLNFANFSMRFLKDNPDVTWDQFENWFMGTPEGQDGEYDAAFWENPNLTFQQQNLPTLAAFKSSMPSKYTDAGTLCNSLGGDVLKMYNAVIADKKKLNTCAIRVSIALIKCGIVIPFIPDSKKGFKNTIKDKDGNYLIINAKALNEWMRKTFGTNPVNYRHFTAAQGGINGAKFPRLMEDLKGDGIYSMVSRPEIHETWGTGHADILEEGDCRIKCHFFDEKNNFVPVDYIDVWILK